MDVVNVIAAVIGVTGAVLGALGWRQAVNARSAAADCQRAVAAATRVAQQVSLATSQSLAAAQVREQAAAPVVRDEANGREAEGDPSQRARIAVRSGDTPGEEIPTNQGYGSGRIGVFLLNGGPAVAHDMQLHAVFPNGTTRDSGSRHSLSPDKEMTLFAQVIPQDFGSAATIQVLYRVTYRDGNGDQQLEQKIRVEGGWKGPWKTFIERETQAPIH